MGADVDVAALSRDPGSEGMRVMWAGGRLYGHAPGMNGLALVVQEAMKQDPHAGDLYVLREHRGNLVKILWHDGIGTSLHAKRLEQRKFVWPSRANGVIAISAAQLAYMLDGKGLNRPQLAFFTDDAVVS